MPFSQIEKDDATALLAEAFGGFKEEILIYRTSQVAFVSTDTSFNFAYGPNQPSAEVNYTPVSGVVWGTVEYIDREDDQRRHYPHPEANVKQPEGDVRIGISGLYARNLLMGAEKVILDGQQFKIASDIMPRGIFQRDYYDCWLVHIK